jgi:hypothetical protein
MFCVVFSCIPLLQFPIQKAFYHEWASPFIVLVLGMLIPSFHALGLNNLIYEKNIIRKDNLVLGFVYLLICTPFTNILTEWLVSFSLLFFLNYLFASYQKEYPFSQIFNALFILSILSFIFPNLLYLALLIIISGISYSNLNWRNASVSCIGLIMPYFFYFLYAILFEKTFAPPEFTNLKLINLPDINNIVLPKFIWTITLLITSLIAFIELFKWLYKKSIRSRKSFLIIFFYFLLIFILTLFSGLQSWYFLITPLCIIIGNYFTYTKNRKVANLLFLLLVLSSFYYRCWIAL